MTPMKSRWPPMAVVPGMEHSAQDRQRNGNFATWVADEEVVVEWENSKDFRNSLGNHRADEDLSP